jgi:hypothetical protein
MSEARRLLLGISLRLSPETELALDTIRLLVFTLKPERRTTTTSPGLACFPVLELCGNRTLGLYRLRTARRKEVAYRNSMHLHQVINLHSLADGLKGPSPGYWKPDAAAMMAFDSQSSPFAGFRTRKSRDFLNP